MNNTTPTPPTEKCCKECPQMPCSDNCHYLKGKSGTCHTTNKGWGEAFEKLLERYADYDGDSDTMYFKTVVPNMETRNLDDNYQIFLVKAQELIQHIAKEEYERGRKDAVEFIRESMPVICYQYSTEEMEQTFEAALETPKNP